MLHLKHHDNNTSLHFIVVNELIYLAEHSLIITQNIQHGFVSNTAQILIYFTYKEALTLLNILNGSSNDKSD